MSDVSFALCLNCERHYDSIPDACFACGSRDGPWLIMRVELDGLAVRFVPEWRRVPEALRVTTRAKLRLVE